MSGAFAPDDPDRLPGEALPLTPFHPLLRQWFEVSRIRTGFGMTSREEAQESDRKWFPHNKGGAFRKWWGNQDYVINWEDDGKEWGADAYLGGNCAAEIARQQNCSKN